MATIKNKEYIFSQNILKVLNATVNHLSFKMTIENDKYVFETIQPDKNKNIYQVVYTYATNTYDLICIHLNKKRYLSSNVDMITIQNEIKSIYWK